MGNGGTGSGQMMVSLIIYAQRFQVQMEVTGRFLLDIIAQEECLKITSW